MDYKQTKTWCLKHWRATKQLGREGRNPGEKGNSLRQAGRLVLFSKLDICQFISGLGREIESKRKDLC